MSTRLFSREGNQWVSRGAKAGDTTPPPVTVQGFSLYGPEAGGFVTGHVHANDGTIYCRTDVGGAYRKDPGVDSVWNQIVTLSSVPAPLFNDREVEGIACSKTQPQHVYVAVGGDLNVASGRIMRSTNGGKNWFVGNQRWKIRGNAESRYGRDNLAVQDEKPEVCWWGSRTEGVFLTLDGNITWTKTGLPQPISNGDGHRADSAFILIDPKSPTGTVNGVTGVRLGVFVGLRGLGVYHTTNGGVSWTQRHSIGSGTLIKDAGFDANGDLVFTTNSPNAIFKLPRLSGAATQLASPGGHPHTIALHPTNSQLMLVGADGLRDAVITPSWWRSTNGGSSWTVLNVAITNGTDGAVWPTMSDLDNYMSAGQIRFDPADPSRIWFSEGMGMWVSTDYMDAETTWVFKSRGIQELVANGMVKPPNRKPVATSWDRGVWTWNADDRAILPHNRPFCSAWDVHMRPDNQDVIVACVSNHQGDDVAPWMTLGERRLSAISFSGGIPGSWERFAGLLNDTLPVGLRFGSIAIARGSNDRMIWAPQQNISDASNLPGLPIRYTTDRWTTAQTPVVTPAPPSTERITRDRYLMQSKIVADPLVNDSFWVVSDDDTNGNTFIWRSTDGGANFSRTQFGGNGNYRGRFNCRLRAIVINGLVNLFVTPGPSGDPPAYMNAAGQMTTMRGIVAADGTVTWSEISTLIGAHDMAWGAPMDGSSLPTLFSYGWVNGARGIYRSIDNAATWIKMTDEPLGWHQGISVMCGDPEVPGKVWVGLPGGSWMVGQA